jgi:hypothetical protein
MIPDESVKKAFDFAADATKQLLTLSTGILTLTIAFSKVIADPVPFRARLFLVGAWACFLISIVFGVMTLLALTGTLDQQPQWAAPISIRGDNVRVPALLQIGWFILALLLTLIFGIALLFSSRPTTATPVASKEQPPESDRTGVT